MYTAPAMRRELSATLGSSEHELVVTPLGGGRFAIALDGRSAEVDAVEVRPGSWSIVVDGRSVVVDLDRVGSGVVASAGAAPAELASSAPVVIEDARRRRLSQATAAGRPKVAGEQLRAPIAGRVVKLLVAEGDVVAAGQGVIVLEAMKMENELKAERGGKVTAIAVTAGQSVDNGAPLVTLT
jgi:biotin carboxyl carrier protein